MRNIYNFLNTCNKCFTDVEYPLLGDFSYGELIFQTKDGQDFFIAKLIGNKTFDFISNFLKSKARHTERQLQTCINLCSCCYFCGNQNGQITHAET